jgi:NADH-quinone oxidoreductase subunit J
MTRAFWIYVTYAAALLGALGLYLAMPRAGRSRRAVAAIFGVGAVAGLLAALAGGAEANATRGAYFYVLTFLTIGGAVRVVTHVKPVYSALYFVLVVLATAGLAVLAGAEFLAAAIVIIYAGAILVTYVFVIMLAQQSPAAEGLSPSIHYDLNAREPLLAVLAGFVLLATLAGVIGGRAVPAAPAVGSNAADNTTAVGLELLTRFAVSVELAGVLLLVAMVGALAIARKPIPADAMARPAVPKAPGEIGRTVKPF